MPERKSICICDLQENACGSIDLEHDKPVVLLSGEWKHIGDAINGDIEAGIPVPTPDRNLILVTGQTAEEIGAIAHVIRVLSERRLRVSRDT